MTQTAYQRGRAFEYVIRNKLRELGFFVVRSAQSKTPVDLVAIRSDVTFLVQCKRDLRLGPKDWNELWEVAKRTNSIALVAGIPNRRVEWRRLVGPKTARGRQPWVPAIPHLLALPVGGCVVPPRIRHYEDEDAELTAQG